jgi:hypothetical protein
VVVRRIVGALRNAGMVSVQPGVGGGAVLAPPSGRDHPAGGVPRRRGGGRALLASRAAAVARVQRGREHRGGAAGGVRRAHSAMEEVLAGVTVAQIGREVMGTGARGGVLRRAGEVPGCGARATEASPA